MTGRRVFMWRAALLPLLAASGAACARATKLSKAQVQYREQPHDGKDCDDCVQFVAGEGPKVAGSCKVVAGVISPHGYCLAFTPKPPG
jgi:hypothetical protein